ncbi:short chain dehydrogenase family protein [Mycobacterium xenopi 3993]|nr:short chain dehydrogenase family protein [Mycobacterium xenopi 3993]
MHELVDYLDGKPPSRALLRAEVRRSRKCFGDMLVAVTGAGSGIGRATALAFAREGAEVVVSDIDETAAKDTAAQIAAQGGVAHPYSLDVADAEAVEAFAEQLCAEHGVPTSSSTTPASARPVASWTPRPSSSTGCSTSISVAWSTGAARSPRGWSRAAPADTSSMSPRWPRGAPTVAERLLHVQGRGVHVLRLPARRTRRGGVGLTTICPGLIDTNIVHTTRFDAPSRRPSRSKAVETSWKGCFRCGITGRTRWPTRLCPRSRSARRSARSPRRRTCSTACPG